MLCSALLAGIKGTCGISGGRMGALVKFKAVCCMPCEYGLVWWCCC